MVTSPIRRWANAAELAASATTRRTRESFARSDSERGMRISICAGARHNNSYLLTFEFSFRTFLPAQPRDDRRNQRAAQANQISRLLPRYRVVRDRALSGNVR